VIKTWTADQAFQLGEIGQQVIPVHDRSILNIAAGEVIYESEEREALLVKGRWLSIANTGWQTYCTHTESRAENALGGLYTASGVYPYSIYIDAARGDDSTADGSRGLPFLTLGAAQTWFAANFPHGNDYDEWATRGVTYYLADGVYDEGNVTLRAHRRVTRVEGKFAYFTGQLTCRNAIADLPNAIAFMDVLPYPATVITGPPLADCWAYHLSAAAASAPDISVTYGSNYATSTFGAVYRDGASDEYVAIGYADDLMTIYVRPAAAYVGGWIGSAHPPSGNLTLHSGTGPATISGTVTSMVPQPLNNAANTSAETFIGYHLLGHAPTAYVPFGLSIEDGVRLISEGYYGSHHQWFYCERTRLPQGGVIVQPAGDASLSNLSWYAEFRSASIRNGDSSSEMGSQFSSVYSSLEVSALDSYLGVPIRGNAKIYGAEQVTYSDIDATTAVTGGSVVGVWTYSWAPFMFCEFGGSTYNLSSTAYADARSASSLIAGGFGGTLSLTQNAIGLGLTANPADWGGSPPVDVATAINRIATHVGPVP